VLLTFGLLVPGKGIEMALEALPEVVAEFPGVVYIVLGATHPYELRTRGEAYRRSLEEIVRKHKLENHVVFHNRFVEPPELTEFIQAADLYITPYLGEAQITSGTLAYAFGAGKAVISTPYWHATELLGGQRGVLVPFADPAAISREVRGLLRDPARRRAMSGNAYRLGRGMVWSSAARQYMASFEAARTGERPAPAQSAMGRAGMRLRDWPVLILDHIYYMLLRPLLFRTRAALRRACRKTTARRYGPVR
jgi:glycosyltransferase involved in cell wall biosynthesis